MNKTPSQESREHGLDGLSHLVRLTKVPERTLINWHKNNPERFQLAIDAALWRNRKDKMNPKDAVVDKLKRFSDGDI